MTYFIEVLKARVGRALAFVVLGLISTGCASYQTKVDAARFQLRSNPTLAANHLEPLALQPTDDQLVYLLDYGTALQQAGDYKKSNEIFLLADKMADYKDYHSITRVAGSMVLNEEMVQYKGDDYEKVLINAMLAYNFLMMGDLDSALVETRRLNEKLKYYRTEQKKNYEQNVFAIYLGALIWEADRKWDDAYIDFKRAYDLNPTIPYIYEDLVRASLRAQRYEDHQKWKKEFNIKVQPEWTDRKYGELVLIYQQGWGPRKQPHPAMARFPKLYPVNSLTSQAKLIVEGVKEERSQKIYSVEDVAIKTLDDAYAALVARRMGGVVVKEVLADQVRQKNQLLGDLMSLGLHLADRADLRQWSTLPESFHVAKMYLKPGTYQVRVQGLSSNGTPTGEEMPLREITIKPGKKTFIGWRSYQ